jgi:hypothetical protein
MADDFDDLVFAIRRVFPGSRFTPLGESEAAAIRDRHPGVPGHYLAFLRRVGAGRLGDGNFMIYDGLCEPSDFFDPDGAAGLTGILFFGDNFSGWMAGFDTRADWRIVGVESSTLEPWPEQAQTIHGFIAQRVSDSESA